MSKFKERYYQKTYTEALKFAISIAGARRKQIKRNAERRDSLDKKRKTHTEAHRLS